MSSALVRQALEFVEPEESDKRKRNKRRNNSTRHPTGTVQDLYHPYNQKNKKPTKGTEKSKNSAEENIKKLLALSTPVAKSVAKDKIIERAIKGKPLLQKVEKPKEDESSILFPEENFEEFEENLFCS
ncbi:uncharacterized protein LOC121727792 [Aricia agestis]|uniref:uncharacterized protein LOC121727792 n=1 Tax=Aricia agestis TaxID=91739 RepID=UPI001C2065A2|nr:uncharacterized protein LOC121727792 [Aricia agestis]